eukprot:m.208666 g.208666  ORF g.208666 m.208666 type:complete len:390 (-) comp22080_c2_seq1:46-1215(-)
MGGREGNFSVGNSDRRVSSAMCVSSGMSASASPSMSSPASPSSDKRRLRFDVCSCAPGILLAMAFTSIGFRSIGTFTKFNRLPVVSSIVSNQPFMPPKSKTKKEKVPVEEPPTEDVKAEESPEQPPADETAPAPQPSDTLDNPACVHPATLGFLRSQAGVVCTDSSKISPVFAGVPWRSSTRTDSFPSTPSTTHPVFVGHSADSSAGGGGQCDAALISPAAVGYGVQRVPNPLTSPSHPLPECDDNTYLAEHVWPTLQPALEKLLYALKYHVPKEKRQTHVRNLNMDEVQGFDAVAWLATFLKRNNPQGTAKYTAEEAASVLQCSYRGYKGRLLSKQLRQHRDQAQQAEDLARQQNAAARKIQAVYRGHSVRVHLAMGSLPPTSQQEQN